MKGIKEHKGFILFIVMVIVLSVVWVNHVEKDNARMNTIQERS